ncbi:translesion error-prone DNA polymerase V autoproteolytic subunit [Gammaproteobacteria bacterium LSUCC0057]|uniref:Translesion error-prone DNA polymerase V autoproteolytic subunit n=1 Tax=Gammaproteobacteria bacterium LSUCC0057 TaxID=2559237 RepID=A0A4Y8UKD4_9GAMM|nr:translesion error-prone DNA polymerase V autoproteolytic subunit [Gammaproteobacteria bacterium LSUCC0057]
MRVTKIEGEVALQPLAIPLYLSRVAAGFPSPADDYIEESIDLNKHVIKRPAATYFARANGDSMTGMGIFDGDLLVVDRSKTAVTGSVVIAVMNGELVCKVLDKERRLLRSANSRYPALAVLDDVECSIEGVVTHALRYLDVRAG